MRQLRPFLALVILEFSSDGVDETPREIQFKVQPWMLRIDVPVKLCLNVHRTSRIASRAVGQSGSLFGEGLAGGPVVGLKGLEDSDEVAVSDAFQFSGCVLA